MTGVNCMKIMKLVHCLLLLTVLFAFPCSDATADHLPVLIDTSRPLINDRIITVKSSNDVQALRKTLIQFLWGSSGFPQGKLPSSVQYKVQSPVRNLANLRQVDTLHIAMGSGLKGLAHHFIPKKKNKRLVVLHLGHSENCTFDDGNPAEPDTGMRKTLQRLLHEGFSVLAVYMPLITPENCRWGHDQLFTLSTTGNPMKFFVETTVVGLNYMQQNFSEYRDFSMIGLSGGGWATTLYAALDPRIKVSIPVAGSLPLYLSWGISRGDTEQNYDNLYRLAGYPDLYVLGAAGPGRRQIQVLNRYDDCCFGESQHNPAAAKMPYATAVRGYESHVKSALKQIGSGTFDVVIDESANRHMISAFNIENVIIPALRRGFQPKKPGQ